MSYDMLDPESDPFHPPAIPTEVGCLHCQQIYESYLIEWRIITCSDGKKRGFWCCPTPGCDGRGFAFDIFPTDPDYRDENGERMWMDDSEEECNEEFEFDPDERRTEDQPGDGEDSLPW
jgi:hypothetical protein